MGVNRPYAGHAPFEGDICFFFLLNAEEDGSAAAAERGRFPYSKRGRSQSNFGEEPSIFLHICCASLFCVSCFNEWHKGHGWCCFCSQKVTAAAWARLHADIPFQARCKSTVDAFNKTATERYKKALEKQDNVNKRRKKQEEKLRRKEKA